jgi:hypothetical protein
VASQQVAPLWITTKLGEQAAWMSNNIHTKQWEVWGSCVSDREKLCILLCDALQSGRYWLTFWRKLLPPSVGYKKNSWPRKDTGAWWQDTDLRIFGSLVSSSHPNPPVRSQSYVPTPKSYYVLRYLTGRQRVQLNGSIPTIEHFKFNWPNGPTMSR